MNAELFAALTDLINNEILSKMEVSGRVISMDSGACYTISKIAGNIMLRLGYGCRVRRVAVIAGDKIGKEIFKKQMKLNRYDKDEVINANGWLIGLGVPPMFHYILWFAEKKEIMDLTYGQANRPERGLVAEPYWCSTTSLPESIVSIEFINGLPEDFDPLYNFKEYRGVFNSMENYGFQKLKRFSIKNNRFQ